VALALLGCAAAVGTDLYREARTERALVEITKAKGFYMRREGSRGRPVISIDLDATLVDDTGRAHPRGHVTDETLKVLSHFEQLSEISLVGTAVTDAGLQALRNLKELKRLNLSQTSLTDAGLDHLKALPELRTIDLRGTKVTPAGVAALRRALPLVGIATGEARSP
jgi:hypothetical protein